MYIPGISKDEAFTGMSSLSEYDSNTYPSSGVAVMAMVSYLGTFEPCLYSLPFESVSLNVPFGEDRMSRYAKSLPPFVPRMLGVQSLSSAIEESARRQSFSALSPDCDTTRL